MLPGREESVGNDTTPDTTGRTAIAVDEGVVHYPCSDGSTFQCSLTARADAA